MNMDFILNEYIIPDKTMTMNGRISDKETAGQIIDTDLVG